MSSSYLEVAKSLVKTAETILTRASEVVVEFINGIKTDSFQLNKQTTAIGLTLVFVGSQVYYWHKLSFWSRRNVKTPTPLPFFGNFLSFIFHPRQHLELEWPKKYGKIYGFYQGTQPYLVCTDANVFKQIAIKDFDKFQDHYFLGNRNKYQENILIFLRGNHWRGMRNIITPTFTSGKIKTIYKLLDRCGDGLVQEYERLIKNGGGTAVVDIRAVFGTFSMGSALKSFYGIEAIKGSPDSEDSVEGYAKRSRLAFTPSPFRFFVCSLLPDSWLKKLNYPLVPESRMEFFEKKARQIIQHRRKSGRNYNDYLQLLLDARANDALDTKSTETDDFEQHHALNDEVLSGNKKATFRQSKMTLTETEVACQAMMLMMVATETTATLLSHVTYLLAEHQQIQQTLYEELCKIQQNSQTGEFDYEQLTTCQYLDSVIAESLRLMTPALAFDRVAMEDYYIEEYGIHVPKGTIINLAFYAIHRDPDYWPEPEKYDPERFMPENKHKIVSGSYCPFGIGPRSCVGFRFALTETKVALAKLLTRYHLERAPGTVYPPIPKKITFVLNDNQNLLVLFEKRK